jgi:AraC-like DNA-binding protein
LADELIGLIGRANPTGEVESLTHRIFQSIAEVYARAPNFPPGWLRELHAYICRDPQGIAPVRHLAQSAGVTREHLSRSFKKYYQVRIAAFLLHKRIENAYHRIYTTNDSLASIAFECGFADQSHLTREFGSWLGITPGRLRTSVRRKSITSHFKTGPLVESG